MGARAPLGDAPPAPAGPGNIDRRSPPDRGGRYRRGAPAAGARRGGVRLRAQPAHVRAGGANGVARWPWDRAQQAALQIDVHLRPRLSNALPELVESGDPRLFNQYGIILVSPEKHPHVEADLGQTIRFIAELPSHVCINEMVISPVWNRIYIGGDDIGRR